MRPCPRRCLQPYHDLGSFRHRPWQRPRYRPVRCRVSYGVRCWTVEPRDLDPCGHRRVEEQEGHRRAGGRVEQEQEPAGVLAWRGGPGRLLLPVTTSCRCRTESHMGPRPTTCHTQRSSRHCKVITWAAEDGKDVRAAVGGASVSDRVNAAAVNTRRAGIKMRRVGKPEGTNGAAAGFGHHFRSSTSAIYAVCCSQSATPKVNTYTNVQTTRPLTVQDVGR